MFFLIKGRQKYGFWPFLTPFWTLFLTLLRQCPTPSGLIRLTPPGPSKRVYFDLCSLPGSTFRKSATRRAWDDPSPPDPQKGVFLMTFDPDLIDFRVPDMPFWVQFEALVLFTPAGMEISLLNLSKSPLWVPFWAVFSFHNRDFGHFRSFYCCGRSISY